MGGDCSRKRSWRETAAVKDLGFLLGIFGARSVKMRLCPEGQMQPKLTLTKPSLRSRGLVGVLLAWCNLAGCTQEPELPVLGSSVEGTLVMRQGHLEGMRGARVLRALNGGLGFTFAVTFVMGVWVFKKSTWWFSSQIKQPTHFATMPPYWRPSVKEEERRTSSVKGQERVQGCKHLRSSLSVADLFCGGQWCFSV